MKNRLKSVFWLTREEQAVISGIVLLVLIGLIARRQHLKNHKPEPYSLTSPSPIQEVMEE